MKFLSRLFKGRTDPTESWDTLRSPLPGFDLNTMSFGPLRFGDDIKDAAFIGRPDRIEWVDDNYCTLLYAPEGFQIDFGHGKLAYVGFFIGPDRSQPEHASLKFSMPKLLGGDAGEMVLTPQVDSRALRERLGEPTSEDTDDRESILNYSRRGITMEFELDASSGRLKRWNLFPDS
jgi:hypothetical protein